MFVIGLAVFCAAFTLLFIGCIINCMWLKKADSNRLSRLKREKYEKVNIAVMKHNCNNLLTKVADFLLPVCLFSFHYSISIVQNKLTFNLPDHQKVPTLLRSYFAKMHLKGHKMIQEVLNCVPCYLLIFNQTALIREV